MNFTSVLSGPDRRLIISMSEKPVTKAYCMKTCVFILAAMIVVLFCVWRFYDMKLPTTTPRTGYHLKVHHDRVRKKVHHVRDRKNGDTTAEMTNSFDEMDSFRYSNLFDIHSGNAKLNGVKGRSHGSKSHHNEESRKRLPNVIIAGIKKCGTGPVRSFLKFHPSVVVNDTEVHYFDRHYSEGLTWYINQMPESQENQLTIEKTPRYFVEPAVPRQIYEDVSPQTKMIFVACEPVHRAVSDYLHIYKHTRKALQVLQSLPSDAPLYITQNERLKRYRREHYDINDTFESTVLDNHGNINEKSAIIQIGKYVSYLPNWFKYFPRDQIHVVDGEHFKTDPAGELCKIEKFLNVEPYFRSDSFYFDDEKGFYCLSKPYHYCLGKNKGREHPTVDKRVLDILADYYQPYNEEFSRLLDQNFSWINS
ncbi:heparan sulfate glucosamine 3-O-sulfotransferase 1-like [Glandiceps talaboti]